jgi:hypothetical protein
MIRTPVAGLRDGDTVTVAGWIQTLRLQRAMQLAVVRDHTGTVQVTHRRDGHRREPGSHSAPDRRPDRAGGTSGLALPRRPAAARRPAGVRGDHDGGAGDARVRLRRGLHRAAHAQADGDRVGIGVRGIRTRLLRPSGPPGAVAPVLQADGGLDRVFEVGPVFRAEPSFTARHATEFTGVDVELAWIDSVEDVMSFEERMLAHVLTAVAAAHGAAIEELGQTEVTVPAGPVPPAHPGRGAFADQNGWC